jgi:hypothetical protein
MSQPQGNLGPDRSRKKTALYPFVYLRDVLGRLPDVSKERLAELLPDRWSPPSAAHPAAAIPAESAPGPD